MNFSNYSMVMWLIIVFSAFFVQNGVGEWWGVTFNIGLWCGVWLGHLFGGMK